jgi:hypothetical protein
MPESEKPGAPAPENQFQQQADQPPVGILREFVDFLRYNKAWWLTPIIIVLLMVGGLMFLAATGAAPFIYTLF